MMKSCLRLIFLALLFNGLVFADSPVIGYPEIRLANFERMKEIIEKGTDLNTFDENDISPLFTSVRLGDIKVTKFLIGNGANVNLVRSDGATPIFLAPTAEMIDFLISHGANLEHTTPYGFTPLTSAIFYEKTHIAEHLVRIGADVNVLKMEGRSPLNMLNERENIYIKRREKTLRDLIIATGGKDIAIPTKNQSKVEKIPNNEYDNCDNPAKGRYKDNVNKFGDCEVYKQ